MLIFSFDPPATASTCRPARGAARIVQGKRTRRKQRQRLLQQIPILNRLSRRHRCPHRLRWNLRESTATTLVHPTLLRLLLRLRSLLLQHYRCPILALMLDPIARRRLVLRRHHIHRPTMECRCRHRVLGCRVAIPKVMPTAVERRRIKSSRKAPDSPMSIRHRSILIHRTPDPMAPSLRTPMPTRITTPTRSTSKTEEILPFHFHLVTRYRIFRTHIHLTHKTISRRAPALRLRRLLIPSRLILQARPLLLTLSSMTMGTTTTRVTI